MILVESIPENLTYPSGSVQHMSTYDAWMELLEVAETSIDIASFYWTLTGTADIQDPSDMQVLCIEHYQGHSLACFLLARWVLPSVSLVTPNEMICVIP